MDMQAKLSESSFLVDIGRLYYFWLVIVRLSSRQLGCTIVYTTHLADVGYLNLHF